jgi:glycosyltransferase involved in cell wall biosynthesis
MNCIRDARKRKFDILLILGYTSSSVWGKWYPKNSIVITNMDGLEWKRSKYTKPVQRFLEYAEKLAVTFSDHHIADSLPIQDYLERKYHIQPAYISYGAELPGNINEDVLAEYHVTKHNYFLLIARMEPENNIEMILQGLTGNGQTKKVLVIGNTENEYGKKMVLKYGKTGTVQFLNTVYDKAILDTLRAGCLLYFHGHSVGGTNPSLLEAMASGAMICAHDNVFNRAVLEDNALYFFSEEDVEEMAADTISKGRSMQMIDANLRKIKADHSWEKIISEYENLFIQYHQSKK